MAEKQSGKKAYRVVQNEGKITWKIEELWDGGTTRSPYGSKDAAIAAEEKSARENGFVNDLVLEAVGEETTLPTDSFSKDSDGTWRCLKGCSIKIERNEVVFAEGMTFIEGNRYLGIDVAKWLEENQ
ncbi:MAG: hypothetical protein ABIB93_06605 [Chloroflexota bacterium]